MEESVKMMTALQEAIDEGHPQIAVDLDGVISMEAPAAIVIQMVSRWMEGKSRRLRVLGASRSARALLASRTSKGRALVRRRGE